MPLYEYHCKKGHLTELYFPVNQRKKVVQCRTCRGFAARVFSAPVIHGLDEYLDEDLGEEHSGEPFHVKSRAHKQRRLRDLGLEERPESYEAKQRRKKGTAFSMPGGN